MLERYLHDFHAFFLNDFIFLNVYVVFDNLTI